MWDSLAAYSLKKSALKRAYRSVPFAKKNGLKLIYINGLNVQYVQYV